VIDGNGDEGCWWNRIGNVGCHAPDCIPAWNSETATNVKLWMIQPDGFSGVTGGDAEALTGGVDSESNSNTMIFVFAGASVVLLCVGIAVYVYRSAKKRSEINKIAGGLEMQ